MVTQIARFGGLDVEMPKFVELVYPKEAYEQKQPSKAEIIENITKRLSA